MTTTRLLRTIALYAALSTTMHYSAEAQTPAGHYADVNGLRMYYEIQDPPAATGSNSTLPLVLLPGALSTIETSFEKTRPALGRTRRVIAIEPQAHGRTSDRDGPLSYEQMADDVDALLDQIGVTRADFFGYSMGGAIAVQLAVRHPARVRKFVFAGAASFAPEGLYAEVLEGEKTLKPADLAGTPFEKEYMRVAPDPTHWPTLIEKSKQLDLTWRGFPREQLRAITAPALLIIGDADIVHPAHTVEMFELLGGGVPGDLHGLPRARLAVLPGTTHVGVVERGDWLVAMITEFLDAPTGHRP